MTNIICFYSKSMKGFYSESHPSMPKDAVKITEDIKNKLLAGEASGQIIAADTDGFPILIPAPALTAAQQNAPIITQLQALDAQKIRAITEVCLAGDHTRLAALEAQAITLRSQLVK